MKEKDILRLIRLGLMPRPTAGEAFGMIYCQACGCECSLGYYEFWKHNESDLDTLREHLLAEFSCVADMGRYDIDFFNRVGTLLRTNCHPCAIELACDEIGIKAVQRVTPEWPRPGQRRRVRETKTQ